MTILAALASIPEREHLLPQVLGSLRDQVSRLHVYLNGYRQVPECVRRLADTYHHDHQNSGAERKLYWSGDHDGIYLSCDDDLIYPPDYVSVMSAAIRRWHGKALITAHGKSYLGRPRNVHDVAACSLGLYYRRVDSGRWVNWGGSGVMAWDASEITIPTEWQHRNMVDAQLAVWSQINRVPIWLVPHEAHWLKSLAMLDPNGLFKRSQCENHRSRNAVLYEHGKVHGWKLIEC